MSIWSFFGKNIKEHFLSYFPQSSSWRVVTWNFNLMGEAKRGWKLEIVGSTSESIEWNLKKEVELKFSKNGKMVKRSSIKDPDQEIKDLMNLSIHATIKHSLELNHPFMLRPVTGVTTLDFDSEARSLAWIQASFTSASKALEQFAYNQGQILEAVFFSGSEPETGSDVLRLILFNLDIFYYLRTDGSLQVVVFDDKNLGHGKAQTPTFHQIIKVTKPQFYDEIIKLVHQLAKVGEIT